MMREYPKSTEADETSFEIKYIIDEIIDRTGKVSNVKVELPKGCLSDVLKSMDRNIPNFLEFKLECKREKVILELGEDLE